jgi:acyl-CoA reductase-like NAD-dependent aldehyde dehydrogenase
MKDESFGPIIGIQAVADDEAAVDLMNDTDYGLTAGVYTTMRSARARSSRSACRQRLLELLRSRQPAAAVVGRRPLGIGLTLSTYGIQTFTRPKAWHSAKRLNVRIRSCGGSRWC